MGLLDYYRQFDDIDQAELNRALRARRARERELALAEVPVLDLSSTEWPDFPHSEIMNAAIYAARGRVNSYPDRHAARIRRLLAERHDVEPRDSVLRLVDAFPRLLVFRTFSKIYGLSGLRAGYAVGSTASSSLLAAIAPALGINVLSQAGIAYALERVDREIDRRREMVVEQRQRLLRELHDLPVDAPDSEANFVWLHAAGLDGAQLTARLEQAKVLVAPGGPLGADDCVRASIRGS